MKKLISIIFLTFFIIITNLNITNATNDLKLKTDSSEIPIEQTFKLYIDIGENINVSAYTLNLHFDKEKVEYIKGPENSNLIEDTVISIWYDETGGYKPKSNEQIAVYEFKAINKGEALFNLSCDFYDSKGNNLNINNTYEKIKIIEPEEEKMIINEGEDNNSLLKIMRLNEEGITPMFSPEITNYYFITNSDTNELEVTAIPEATNAKVNIKGNKNLKEGLNKISIEVTSRDRTSKTTYNINVTKTNNIESANANLETLAIENVLLEPIFETNILNYKATVSSEIENLNLFAVAENINAKVKITGKDNLRIGDNIITVNVLAPNGFTSKKYEVIVHRRTKEEDINFQEEKKIELQKLNNLLEEKEEFNRKDNNNNNTNNQKNINISAIIVIIIVIIIVLILCIIIIIKRKNKNKNI